jgi:hypothetical protein
MSDYNTIHMNKTLEEIYSPEELEKLEDLLDGVMEVEDTFTSEEIDEMEREIYGGK